MITEYRIQRCQRFFYIVQNCIDELIHIFILPAFPNASGNMPISVLPLNIRLEASNGVLILIETPIYHRKITASMA